MALQDKVWYVDFGDGSTTGYYAVAAFAASHSYNCADIVRQLTAPSVGNERCFVIIVGNASSGAEPTWTNSRGAKNTSGSVTLQECTGIAALNGDVTNTPNWTAVKNTSVTLGQVIQSNDGTKLLICTTAGTAGNGSEPSWAAYTTTGATTSDNSATWTTLKDSSSKFGNWAAPHARLVNAFASNWGQAGNKFFVASEHAETQASAMTLSSPGTASAPCHVISVGKTNVPPGSSDVTSGATINTTGASGITFNSGSATEWCYYKGVTIKSGSSSSAASILFDGAAAGAFLRLEDCTLQLNNTGSSFFEIGASSSCGRFEFINPSFLFGATGQCFSPGGPGENSCLIRGGSIAASGSVPTNLFSTQPPFPSFLLLDGVDLSTINTTLFNNSNEPGCYAQLRDCKLNASVTILASGAPPSTIIDVIRCDSGGHTYRNERHSALADETTETTVIRTGGASFNGTGLARKIISSSKCARDFPYESLPLVINNKSVGSSKTLTVYGIWGGGAVPTSDQIWIETKYPGSSGSPLSTIVTTAPANLLAAGANLTSDSSSWGGSTTAFKMAVTFTPQLAGPIETYVRVGAASQTFYVDEAPTLQ